MRTGHKVSPHTGSFARWLKANEGKMLPRDFDQLRKISGCSKDAITCYFYRRRGRVKDVLKTLPDLRQLDVVLQDTFGRTYNTSDLTHYEYMIDKFSLKVSIFGRLDDGTGLYFDLPDLAHFAKVVKDLQGQQPESSLSQETPASYPPAQRTPKLSVHSEAGYFPATFRDNLDKDLSPQNDEQD